MPPDDIVNLCGVNSTWNSPISSRMHTDLSAVGEVDGPVSITLPSSDGNEWHLGGVYWSLSKKPSSDLVLSITTNLGVVFRVFISKDKDGNGELVFCPPVTTGLGSQITVALSPGLNGSQMTLNLNAWKHEKSVPHY